jgi:photosystem II biogenesis protein Psp29
MNKPPTVSDTKQAFYQGYPQPINSIFRAVFDEILVETHLGTVAENFVYDGFFGLGLKTAYDTMMEGYQPADQKVLIFPALINALRLDQNKILQDSQELTQLITQVPGQEILEVLSGTREPVEGPLMLVHRICAGLIDNQDFKYSRFFAIGLMMVFEGAASKVYTKTEERKAKLASICERLKLNPERVSQDMDTYTSAVELIRQSKSVLDEVAKVDREKRAAREAEKQSANKVAPAESTFKQGSSGGVSFFS